MSFTVNVSSTDVTFRFRRARGIDDKLTWRPRVWTSISKLSRTHSALMGRREELGRLDESDLFMELIRDVANELDINVLCHKILVNVGLLTHADRGSLFLAKGPLEDRYLIAKLFDVTQDTELDEAMQRAKSEEIKIPFGVGIAGYVAQTKEIINIKDAYKVSLYASANR